MTSLLEPQGHLHETSKFERVWEQIPKGYGFTRRRVERFDPINMIAFSPVEYEFAPFAPLNVVMSDDDIRSDFIAFVRDEFPEASDAAIQRYPGLPKIVGRQEATMSQIVRYLDVCEDAVVYGPYTKDIWRRSGNIGAYVCNILCDAKLGNSKNRKHLDTALLADRITLDVQQQRRLMFAFLGFPFKDQNPTRTMAPATHVDYAEIGLLLHLHLQALALFQHHPFGTDYVVLSDGTLYAGIFGIEEREARQYVGRVRALRNILNVQGSIHIVDLQECLKRFADEEIGEFQNLRKRTRSVIDTCATEQGDARVNAAFRNLCFGMRRNLNTRELLKDCEWSEQVDLIYGQCETARAPKPGILNELRDRSREAALEYAAINVALRRFNVVQRVLQDQFRATIHPKAGQVAVPRSGTTYPWNGIGVRSDLQFPDGIESKMIGELGRPQSEWIAGYFPGETIPAFYQAAR